jgi:hypothetical protein
MKLAADGFTLLNLAFSESALQNSTGQGHPQTIRGFCPGDLPGQKLRALRAALFGLLQNSEQLRYTVVIRPFVIEEETGAAG